MARLPELIETFPTPVQSLLAWLGIDFQARSRPNAFMTLVALVPAVVGSIGADIVLIKLGVKFLKAPRNYSHFHFHAYATLTTIGVVIAGLAWPIVAGLSSRPNRLYRFLAIVVTAVLLAPDAYLYLKHEPARAVTVLVAMHLAIAIVTYLVVVSVAPATKRT
jgi:hypothetical protein